MAPLPAGIPFLIRGVLLTSIPPLFIYASAQLLQQFAEISLPTWAIIIAAVCSVPLSSAFRIWSRYWRVSRDARRMGATLPPSWEGKSIGNFDLLQALMQDFKSGYVGEWMPQAVNWDQ